MGRALGRYEILRPLARGGMAEVFLARRRVAGAEKRLVIKRIRPERAADPRFLDLFVKEARLSMALAHQNIVPVFDFGRVGDDLFLAMEEVEGHDLGATLARGAGAPLEPILAAFIAAECAAGLDYAHRRRDPEGEALLVVHRDVSPRNILVSWSGEVKLADFGVAALAGEADASVRGTPAYMAPEQARREPVDGRSDVYALGLVLWELLVGRRARTGADASALIAEARDGTTAAPDGVPEALRAVLARATAPAPGDRYATAGEMHDDLDAFVAVERGRRPEHGAPRRRLADWMAAAWAGEEHALAAEPAAIDGKLVTFVDDGPDEVLGRTHRSIAETMGPDEPAGTEPAPVEPAAPPPAPAAAPARRPWIAAASIGAIGALALAGGVVIATGALGSGASRGTAASAQLAVTPPAAAPPPRAQPQPAPTPPQPVAVKIASSPDDATAGPAPKRPVPAAGKHPHAAATPVATPPSEPLRAVTIGATPWADFTIDDDPTRHETPETVHLAPGRHVVHFDNPTLQILRTTPIDVPADHDVGYVEHMDR